MKTQTIWLARHGYRLDFAQPSWFETATYPYDPPLANLGEHQAQDLANRLRQEQISQIFCSPYLRAVQTGTRVAQNLNQPIKLEPGLREWLNPAWSPSLPSLTPRAALIGAYPQIDQTYQPLCEPAYPESEGELYHRTARVIQILSDRYPEQQILIITHAMAIQGLTWGILPHRPPINTSCCALVKLVKERDQWHLDLAGDTSHLRMLTP
ncbi:MAG: histidine phosphatase family protein [Pseudanabaenaceae cyanobacterium bins.68]|nr:histidine phosphatase family protein [Pseudanabaenaceae cyanobacterium bins.68]